jgi:hypothetical protein
VLASILYVRLGLFWQVNVSNLICGRYVIVENVDNVSAGKLDIGNLVIDIETPMRPFAYLRTIFPRGIN